MDEPPIRVVLSGLPAVVAAIVHEAVRGEGILIVDEVTDASELTRVVARARADVVIVATERSGVAQQHHELLRANPTLRILAVAAATRSADLYELRLLGNNIGPQGVVEAIHAVMECNPREAGESSPA